MKMIVSWKWWVTCKNLQQNHPDFVISLCSQAGRGTVKASGNFNANADAEVLYKAMKGLGEILLCLLSFDMLKEGVSVCSSVVLLQQTNERAWLRSSSLSNYCGGSQLCVRSSTQTAWVINMRPEEKLETRRCRQHTLTVTNGCNHVGAMFVISGPLGQSMLIVIWYVSILNKHLWLE